MRLNPAKAFVHMLLAVHGFLALWAIAGFIEWFSPTTPWPRVSNEHFPRGILFMQWLLTLLAAAIFIIGYALRWRHTPITLALVYAAMAALCAVETFGYMESVLF